MKQHSSIPSAAKKDNSSVTVTLRFIVNTEGALSSIKAISGPAVFYEEAIRLLKQGGRWIPAVQNGNKAIAYTSAAVVFPPR